MKANHEKIKAEFEEFLKVNKVFKIFLAGWKYTAEKYDKEPYGKFWKSKPSYNNIANLIIRNISWMTTSIPRTIQRKYISNTAFWNELNAKWGEIVKTKYSKLEFDK